MKNPTKYAFIEIESHACKGKKFDFATAQAFLGKKIPDAKVKFKRTDSKGKIIPIEAMKPYEKEVEKWRLAGDLIIKSLAEGDTTALVKPTLSGDKYFAVPVEYWRQNALSTPTAGLLTLHSAEWQPFSEFHDKPIHLLASDINNIVANVPEGKPGPKEKYDWARCEAHIVAQNEYHGGIWVNDREWSCQADVIREMVDFFIKIDPENIPSPTTLKRHAKTIISGFKDRI